MISHFLDRFESPFGVGTNLPWLRRFLHRFGAHSPYYKYGPEVLVTWEQIQNGMEAKPPIHLGWHCRICQKPCKR